MHDGIGEISLFMVEHLFKKDCIRMKLSPRFFFTTEIIERQGDNYGTQSRCLLSRCRPGFPPPFLLQSSFISPPLLHQVAWTHIDRQLLLTIDNITVTLIPRFTVRRPDPRTWTLQIRAVEPKDTGSVCSQQYLGLYISYLHQILYTSRGLLDDLASKFLDYLRNRFSFYGIFNFSLKALCM